MKSAIGRKIAVTATVAVTAVLAGAGLAPVALAGSSLCPRANVCIYDHDQFNGLLAARSGGQGAVNVGGAINDKMTSWENKSSYNARWYRDANSSGTCNNMARYSENGNVGWWNSDILTSWATDGGC